MDASAAPAHGVPRDLVLDTNVVLDWLVFRNHVAAPLEGALTSGRFRWLCTPAMRDEFARVIGRETLAHRVADADALLSTFDVRAVRHDTPAPLGAIERLTCTDPDDQMFIDLAIARRVHALLTRDRAVLRLAARGRRLGVLIVTPERWLDATGSLVRDTGASQAA